MGDLSRSRFRPDSPPVSRPYGRSLLPIGGLRRIQNPNRSKHRAAAAKKHVGTAALGCPAERCSAISLTGKGRAMLDRTAEGGCPHVVWGDACLGVADILRASQTSPVRCGQAVAGERGCEAIGPMVLQNRPQKNEKLPGAYSKQVPGSGSQSPRRFRRCFCSRRSHNRRRHS